MTRIPGKSDLAKAFRYGLSRWSSFCLPSGPSSAFGRATGAPDRCATGFVSDPDIIARVNGKKPR